MDLGLFSFDCLVDSAEMTRPSVERDLCKRAYRKSPDFLSAYSLVDIASLAKAGLLHLSTALRRTLGSGQVNETDLAHLDTLSLEDTFDARKLSNTRSEGVRRRLPWTVFE